jgi:hypothetical protein
MISIDKFQSVYTLARNATKKGIHTLYLNGEKLILYSGPDALSEFIANNHICKIFSSENISPA